MILPLKKYRARTEDYIRKAVSDICYSKGTIEMNKYLLLTAISLMSFVNYATSETFELVSSEEKGVHQKDTEDMVYKFLSTAGLTDKESTQAYLAWRSAQQPIIAITDLASFIRTKRDALTDGFCKFTVEDYGGKGANFIVNKTIVERAFSGDMVLRQEEDIISLGHKRYFRKSYNGECVLTYFPDRDTGNIMEFQGYVYYTKSDDILSLAMLADSQRDFFEVTYWADLVALLKHADIQQTTEFIDGSECLVVLCGQPLWFKVYLDIECDFSVRRLLQYRSDDKNPSARLLTMQVGLEDLRDCGNGVWLPSIAKRTRFNDGEPISVTTVKLDEAYFNTGLPPSLFNDVIPASAVVHDAINHTIYRNVDNPEDVQYLLDSTIPTLSDSEKESN